MSVIADFVTGRSNRLLRDMLVACVALTGICAGVLIYVSSLMSTMRTAHQPLPPRAQMAGGGQNYTVTRSILDGPVFTGSVGGRVILDPCTGKEKK